MFQIDIRRKVFKSLNIFILEILSNIQRLNQYIAQGNSDAAGRLGTLLSSQGVQLQAKPVKTTGNEQEFT